MAESTWQICSAVDRHRRPDLTAGVSGDLQHQAAGGHAEHIVAADAAAQALVRDALDDTGPVHGVNHLVADQKHDGASSPMKYRRV